MMPGHNQSKTAAIAAEATIGNCQNCSVLHQSLAEYVSSFLALKQKITVSDDTVRLQEQVEELQISVVTLEKKTADYEALQAELEEKKSAVKAYEQLSEEMKKLKQENSLRAAENQKLEDQLKSVKDLTETQSFENAKLKREKAALENDLLQAQALMKRSQAQAEKAEKLMEEKAAMTSQKDSLENKVQLLKDSINKQNHQISQLTREKFLLEGNIADLQERLIKLERNRCKDYKSATSQTTVPVEPKVDKERVRVLLQNLWACLDPEQERSADQLLSTESNHHPAPPYSLPNKQPDLIGKCSSASHKISDSHRDSHRDSHSDHVQMKAVCSQLKRSPRAPGALKLETSPQRFKAKSPAKTPKKSKRSSNEQKPEEPLPDKGSCEISLSDIMNMFQPLPPCLSPMSESDTNIEPMESADDGISKDRPETPDGSAPLKEEDSSNGTGSKSSHSGLESSAPQTEENMDLQDVKTGNQFLLYGKDLSQNESSGPAQISDETCDKDGGICPEDMEPMEEAPPSSSDSAVLAEVVSLSAESLNPLHSVNPSSECAHSASEVKPALNSQNDDSITVTKMDVDSSIREVLGAMADDPQCGESLLKGDATVSTENEKQVDPVSQPAKETVATENGTEIEKDPLNSFKGSQETTSLKLGEPSGSPVRDSEMPECAPSVTGDGMVSVSHKSPGQRSETDAARPRCGAKDSSAAHTLKEVTASPSESNAGSKSLSAVMKREDEEPHSDKGCVEDNSETPTKADVDAETTGSEVMAGCAPSLSRSPGTASVGCKSLEKNTPSVCRELSPTCLSPSAEGTPAETGEPPVDDDTELSATIGEHPEPHTGKDDTSERASVRGLPPDHTYAGSSVPASQNAAAAEALKNFTEFGEGGTVAHPAATKTSENIGHVRSEMGPPLPPVLTPLSSPPKAGKSINPRHAIGKLSFPSPLDGVASPSTPVHTHLTPNSQPLCSSSLDSPVPSSGVPSSPLQFGSATPKHAVPVPGRLPAAKNSSPSSSTSPSQENSMRMLDTMYPELSARARTLSILRGNVSLGIGSSESGALSTAADNQMSGFKTISSTSTAFTKTEMRGNKRPAISSPQPTGRKSLRLDSDSPAVSSKEVPALSSNSGDEATSPQRVEPLKSPTSGEPAEPNLIADSLMKIRNMCFDLLPVLQSCLYVGNMPKGPVLRDEEKEVISEICQCNSLEEDDMISAIATKLKTEKDVLSPNYTQALCRVYTGICRQRRHYEKARILAYSILLEDFPESAKLVLFMVTTWPSFLSHSGSLCQAIRAITKLKAEEGLHNCFSKFFGWEKNPPCDIDQLITQALFEFRSGSNKSFIKHSHYGEDLPTEAWDCIFTLRLLCSHKKWKWTYENVVGKELWPLMNDWVTQPRDQQEPVSDMTVASVIRLTGCLGQLGLQEKCVPSVVTVASVMNTFGRHGQTQGVPWEVQLAAVYCIYDLSPCNPKQALEALAEWRRETTRSVPPAVTSCMTQLGSICRQVKR
ncbi:little elongation complex subunit 1 [Menidia menidia]